MTTWLGILKLKIPKKNGHSTSYIPPTPCLSMETGGHVYFLSHWTEAAAGTSPQVPWTWAGHLGMVGKGSSPRQPAGRDCPWQGSSDGDPTVIVSSMADTRVPDRTSASAVEDSTALTDSATSTFLPWGQLAGADS